MQPESSNAAGGKQATIYQAPEPVDPVLGRSVFLAGSITAKDWRAVIIRQLEHLPITIFNPLREDWDDSWVERKTDPQFYKQVEWELAAQERADIVAIYLQPGTGSPISLLELGLSARVKGKVVVCCPEGFSDKGIVEIVCERHKLDLVETLEDLVANVAKKVAPTN